MSEKILFVDDEPLVLDGYRRMLHNEFDVTTALGGEQGLTTIEASGPFAVVVSDMRMPGMNGAQFLSQVRQNAPTTVRMLLTGYTDLNAAMDAVNEGNIFRYLTKPCEKQVLVAAINIGLVQYRSIKAEKELLKRAEAFKDAQAPKPLAPEPDSIDACPWDNFLGPTGLPGPTQARSYLDPLLGIDHQSYVVLFRLTVLQTIEVRYGEEAVGDYLNYAAQFLMQALHAEDRIFHWGKDVLMAVIRRATSADSVRMEVARLALGSHEYLINANGRCIMINSPITFEMLPAGQFSNLDALLDAFTSNQAVKS